MMCWAFEQLTGNLYAPNGELVATGYAGGNCGKNPEGRNNPAMQNVHNVGPLPRGIYTFGTPVDHTHLGPFAIPLIPDPENDMMGRGDFFMHGDNSKGDQSASEGCIIMPRTIREECAASENNQLHVIAQHALDNAS